MRRQGRGLPKHVQLILFAVLCLVGAVAMALVAIETMSRGKINLAPRTTVGFFLYARDHPIVLGLDVAFFLLLALGNLYGFFWCVRRLRQAKR